MPNHHYARTSQQQQQQQQHLTIVLLCSGNGSDASQYRPSRDDVRYRNRHDALVRCVAASLYGAATARNTTAGSSPTSSSAPAAASSSCELIFLYDGDLACMHMTLTTPPFCAEAKAAADSKQLPLPPPPLEKDIVTAWKNAANEALRLQQHVGVNQVTTMKDDTKHKASWQPSSKSVSSMGNLTSSKFNKKQNAPGEHRQSIHGSENVSIPQLNTKCVLDSWKSVDSSKFQGNVDGSPTSPTTQASSTKSGTTAKKSPGERLPTHMPASKRDTLSLLQSTCSVDYLRQHRLNVPLDLALRKFNKGKLQKIWEEYNNDSNNVKANGEREKETTKLCEGGGQWDRMERTFRGILSKARGDDSSRNSDQSTSIIAAYLHESCDAELPCWGWDSTQMNEDAATKSQHIFLFLGAVRDMTDEENNALSHACKGMHTPLVPCRLGPVPEFTSKIVSVAGYHFYRGRLGSGLVALWKKQCAPKKAIAQSAHQPPIPPSQRTLHTIAIVPMDSESLSSDPSQRNRTLWCMVRLCVCSLWRSKLASDSSSASNKTLDNTLTFLFQDGVQITLNQKSFTSSLADKHKAAPSERQILEELCSRRDSLAGESSDMKKVCKEIVSSSMQSLADDHCTFALDFICLQKQTGGKSLGVMDLAYSKELFEEAAQIEQTHASIDKNFTLFAIQHLRPDQNEESNVTSKTEKTHKKLLRAFSKAGVQVRYQSPYNSSQDAEAGTLVMLQHLDYQGRLFYLLSCMMADDTMNLNHEDKKKKKKKSKKRKRSS